MVHSLVLHISIATLSLYLFIVFAWWWHGKGDATKIYKINCFLMFGLFLTHTLAVVKYIMVLFYGHCLTDVFTWYLTFQQYFVLIPLIAYFVHVNGKIMKR